MTKKLAWLARVFVMLALGLTIAGAPLAQTKTAVDVRIFEVISVDGNQVVLRDDRGTNEYTVPNDFRLTVDGKKVSVSELKPGMKGTATVTTTTTIKPVVVTEIRKGVVLSVGPGSVTVLDDADGLRKRFTRAELNDRGIQIVKDGRVIPFSELNRGDEFTATIVSQGPPTVVTEQEVQATLAQSQSQPKAQPKAQSKTESPSTSTGSPAGAVVPSAPAASAPATEATAASAPAEGSGLGAKWYLLIAVLVAGLVIFIVRRKKGS